MSFFIHTPPENICQVLEKFRRDIKNNQFTISTHANARMVSRGISGDEIVNTVAKGVLGTGKVIQDYIGGKFFLGNLCVVVYAPFGVHSASPNIVTVYRDGESDEYEVAELPNVRAVKELESKVKELTATVKTSVNALSDAELEQVLVERRRQRADSERTEAERRRQQLEDRLAQLLHQRSLIDDEIGQTEIALGVQVVARKRGRPRKTTA